MGTGFSKIGFGVPDVNWLFTLELIMGAAILFLVWKLVIPIFRYPIIVEYFEIKGGKAHRPKRDYAKIMVDEGVKRWYLHFAKTYIEPVGEHLLFPIGKRRKKAYMVQDASEMFHPIELTIDKDGAIFKSVERDVMFFFQQERKAKFEKYMMTGWKANAPLIAVASVVILSLVIIILTVKYAGTAVESTSGAVGAMANSVDKLSEAIRTINPGTINP